MGLNFPDFIGNWQARRVGKKIGDETVRTRKLISELEEQFPDLKKPNVIDPALKVLLEEKVKDGRMTREAFEAELRKYSDEQK